MIVNEEREAALIPESAIEEEMTLLGGAKTTEEVEIRLPLPEDEMTRVIEIEDVREIEAAEMNITEEAAEILPLPGGEMTRVKETSLCIARIVREIDCAMIHILIAVVAAVAISAENALAHLRLAKSTRLRMPALPL